MLKRSGLQENIITLHVYASNNRISKFIEQKKIMVRKEKFTVMVGDVSTPLSH